MEEASTGVKLFCSYAHADERWLRKLEIHLSLLKQQGLISLWYDRLIVPGTNWAKVIDTHLETASVILLLVSANFFASDYCVGIEMKRALEREAAGEALVVPILVRQTDWTHAPFAHLHALPTNAKPLATWKDKERALADVAAGIRRALEEVPRLSVSAPRAPLPAIWNIPYPRNPFFMGREDLLSHLHTQLQRSQPMALSQHPQAISGLGGIGKTQIAIEYAYRFHQEYQVVLWAHAESREAFLSSYVTFATLLNLPEQHAQEHTIIVQAVKRWLQTHSKWLLILDNADELTLVPEFLPSTLGGHLLLTTRAHAMGRLASRIEVETFSAEQGALFLLRRAALLAPDASLEQATLDDRERATQVSQELGGLLLALDQAGAYLEETGCSLSEYHHLSQQRRAYLLKERRGLVDDHPPVATTWSLSFQKVKEKNPAAADLLRFCTFLSPDAIPEEILTADTSLLGPVLASVAADAPRLNQALEVLLAYSLVRRDPKGKTLSIHRLVQVVFEDTMEDVERRSWAERVILSVNAAFPRSGYGTWLQCERLLSQAWTAIQFIEQYQMVGKETERLLLEVAYYLWDRGRYAEGEPLYQQLLRIREPHLGPEHPQVASVLSGLGDLYWRQGKYTDAESLLLRALQIIEQQLGSEHPQVASVLFGLATVYRYQGRYAQSELLYQRELHIEQQLGLEHPGVVDPLNNLAALYSAQGKYVEAEPLLLQALQISKQQLGSEHYMVGYSLITLATLYEAQRKYAEAELVYQQTLRIWEQYYGPEHPEVARPLIYLARLYHDQGKYTEAELFYQRGLSIQEQQAGSNHLKVTSTLSLLANLYTQQGKYTEATPLYQQALLICEQRLASDPNDAAVYHLRGYLYLRLRKREYACADFARQASLQPGHVDAAWMVVFTALSKQHPGFELAERLEAIALLDPEDCEAYVCRGVALGLRGNPQEGLTELEHALHRNVHHQDALFWKGMMCAYLGQNTVARESIEQALQVGLPLILLTPLFWLEQDSPHFYHECAEPLLKRYDLA